MKKFISISLLALAVSSCSTYKSTSVSSSTTADATKYVNSITSEDLKIHLTIVASDEMEGREKSW